MATITLNTGNNPVIFTGTAPLALSSQPWYTQANVSKIFAVTSNGAGYTNGQPGSNFGVTQLAPAAAGQRPAAYIIVAKQAFTLDADTFGASPERLVANFPSSPAQNTVLVKIKLAKQAGTYALPTTGSQINGLTGISFSKGGSAIAGTVTLAIGDIVAITATNNTGTDADYTFIKQ